MHYILYIWNVSCGVCPLLSYYNINPVWRSNPLLRPTPFLQYLVCLVPSGEILHFSAIPTSEWDWIWKYRVLQTGHFCWSHATWQLREQDTFLRETNTTTSIQLWASWHIKPDVQHTHPSVYASHCRKGDYRKIQGIFNCGQKWHVIASDSLLVYKL